MKLSLCILLLYVHWALSQSGDGSTTSAPDYDVEDMFTTQAPTTVSCDNIASASGSGSGSGLQPECMDESTTQPPPDPMFLMNCTVPDTTPATPTVSSLDTAYREAFCFAQCVDTIVGSRIQASLLEQLNFPGFPLWSAVTKSFLLSNDGATNDCLEGSRFDLNGCTLLSQFACFDRSYQNVLDCERGCLVHFQDPTNTNCMGTCTSQCRSECAPGPFGCLVVYPCGLGCNGGSCSTGCSDASNSLGYDVTNDYPSDAQPTLPPFIDQVPGSRELYFIDLSQNLPDSNRRLSYVTIILKLEDLSLPENYTEPEYIVLDEGFQFNLGAYTCRMVAISYAVSTVNRGVSQFSPPTFVNVTGVPPIVIPCQLEGFEVVLEDNPNLFRHRNIHITWEQPCNPEAIESYQILLLQSTMNPKCGSLSASITEGASDATSFTFSAVGPYDDNNIQAPIAGCLYSLQVIVHPQGPDGVPAIQPVGGGNYNEPDADSIAIECESRINNETGTNYILTFNMIPSPSFSQVYVSQVINSLDVNGFEYDSEERAIPASGFTNDRVFPDGGVFLENELRREYIVNPLSPGFQYGITVTLRYRDSSSLPGSQSYPIIFARCFYPDVGPVAPGNITSSSVEAMIVGEPSDNYNMFGVRSVFANIEVSWDQPVLQGDGISSYDVRINKEPIALNEMPVIDSSIISAPSSALTQSQFRTFSNLPAGTFTVFVQVRAANVPAQLFSFWTEPLALNVSVFDPPQPGTMEPVEHFNITTTPTYELANNGLSVMVEFMFRAPMVTFGQITQYQLYAGARELSALEEGIDFNQLTASENSEDVLTRMQTFSLTELPESNTFNVFVQMRAVTNFENSMVTRTGNWSEPDKFQLTIATPPQDIRTPAEGVFNLVASFSPDGGIVLTVEIDLEWTSPNFTVGEARRRRQTSNEPGFNVAVGTEPLPMFVDDDNIPDDTRMQSFPSDSESGRYMQELTFNDRMELVNSTLYLQIQTITSQGSGPWSDPLRIPINPNIPISVPISELGLALGLIFAVLFIVTVIVIIVPLAMLAWRKRKYQYIPEEYIDNNMMKYNGFDDTIPHIFPGEIKGKEPLLDEWEVDTGEVIVEDHLGEGAFGMVFKGTIRGPLRNSKLSPKLKQAIAIPVAIKLLKDTASRKERKDFLDEIETMKKISDGFNPHVVNMVGCVTLQEPLCLITEFVPHGDLLDYLRRQRKKASSKKRGDAALRQQLEQQKKAYDELRKKVELLQSAQDEEDPRMMTGGTGYAEFPMREIEAPPTEDNAVKESDIRDQVEQEEAAGLPSVVAVNPMSEENSLPTSPAPYLEAGNEYSHLDPAAEAPPTQEVEETEDPDELGELEATDLMQFAYQIATGMEYLASLNIVHRDLACRNILVGEDKNLKITDFGLSREVEEVYVKKTRGRLPLKWMAIESVCDREFSTASDVWAFGVVLWEIGTLGGFPYPTINNSDLLTMLKQGYRLEKPDNCAPEVYQVMLECWNEHPEDRPTFTMLRSKFGDMLLATSDDPYMVLEVDDQKAYYTVESEDEEPRSRSDSLSSTDSDSSIKKKKKSKEIKKPVWKPSNPYVDTPAGRGDDKKSEEPNSTVVTIEDTGPNQQGTLDNPPLHPIPELSEPGSNGTHMPEHLRTGVPMSLLSEEKPNQHRAVSHIKSNPYVDAPGTEQLLPELQDRNDVGRTIAEEVNSGNVESTVF